MNALNRSIRAAALAAGLLTSIASSAAELFDPAGALSIAKWIKGEPVDITAGRGTNVYVVEFWATWCGPCRATIPHLTELQKKFKAQNVRFIGVSDEESSAVKPFVDKMGSKMDYAVALDKDGKTSAAFMKAYGQGGIPTAFVINQAGEVAWYGHPMGGLDEVLSKITSGKYDRAAAKKEKDDEAVREQKAGELNRAFNEYMQLVMADELSEKAPALGRKIIKDAGAEAGVLNQIAQIVLNNESIRHRDVQLAKEAALAAVKHSEGKHPVILDTLAKAQAETGSLTEAIATQKKAVALADTDELKQAMSSALKKYEERAAKAGK